MGAITPIDFEKSPVAPINFAKNQVTTMDCDIILLKTWTKRKLAPSD